MRRRDKGWPIPPPAPRTVTLDWRAAEDENDIAAEDAEVETDLREMRGIAAGRVVRKLQWTGQMKRLSVHTLVLC